MRCSILALSALLLTATPALAQGGPPIAYAKDGGSPEIYLVNPDGSGLRLVYRGARRTKIFNLDMRPGGGELSFEETACCSDGPTKFKTVKYEATGTLGQVSRSFTTCRITGLDYHPSNGSILYSDNCARKVQLLAEGSTAPVDVGVPEVATRPAWLSDGIRFLYWSRGWVRRSSTDAPASSAQVVYLEAFADLDPGKSTDQALHAGVPSTYYIDRITLPSQIDRGIGQGTQVSFAPGDVEFIYITPPQRGQSYLKIRRLDGLYGETRIGGSASYSAVDWRN